jgi:hypothetical protein
LLRTLVVDGLVNRISQLEIGCAIFWMAERTHAESAYGV